MSIEMENESSVLIIGYGLVLVSFFFLCLYQLRPKWTILDELTTPAKHFFLYTRQISVECAKAIILRIMFNISSIFRILFRILFSTLSPSFAPTSNCFIVCLVLFLFLFYIINIITSKCVYIMKVLVNAHDVKRFKDCWFQWRIFGNRFSLPFPPPPSLCSCLLFSRHTLKAFFSRVCMFVIECTCYIKEYLIRMMRPSECDDPNVVTKWMGTNNLKWHHIGLHGRFRSNLDFKKTNHWYQSST